MFYSIENILAFNAVVSVLFMLIIELRAKRRQIAHNLTFMQSFLLCQILTTPLHFREQHMRNFEKKRKGKY